jgi:hypothetical protein
MRMMFLKGLQKSGPTELMKITGEDTPRGHVHEAIDVGTVYEVPRQVAGNVLGRLGGGV